MTHVVPPLEFLCVSDFHINHVYMLLMEGGGAGILSWLIGADYQNGLVLRVLD
jgi:hypothetical protein